MPNVFAINVASEELSSAAKELPGDMAHSWMAPLHVLDDEPIT